MTPEILEEDSSEHQEEMPVIDLSLTKAEIEACEEQCKNHFGTQVCFLWRNQQ